MNEMIRKQLGYAAKNYGKWTSGHVYTDFGVKRIGYFTNHPADKNSFKIRHIDGMVVSIECDNLSGAANSYLVQKNEEAKSK